MANGDSTMPTMPAQQQNISELAPTLKTLYPRTKLDPMGLKYAKGHRTADMLSGQRPIMRRPRRAR